jgi:ParB family chromosome partitioning protein
VQSIKITRNNNNKINSIGDVMKKKGLGRGLEALLGPAVDTNMTSSHSGESIAMLPLDYLSSGEYQPRQVMDETAIAELAESIREQGVMQPILVRPIAGNRYEIIAGERRWRASKLLGLSEIPALIKDVSATEAAAMALIENIQREDLNPIEVAQGVARLQSEFDLTHEEVAKKLGRSRSAISNLLRLLNLAKPVQTMLLASDIEMGHARALLSLTHADQISLAQQTVAQKLTVREVEKRVKLLLNPPAQVNIVKKESDADVRRLSEQMSDAMGTTVKITANRNGEGKMLIHFSNLDDLDLLVKKITPSLVV